LRTLAFLSLLTSVLSMTWLGFSIILTEWLY
jgi:hypothetical protein